MRKSTATKKATARTGPRTTATRKATARTGPRSAAAKRATARTAARSTATKKATARTGPRMTARKSVARSKPTKVVLLSGGNPQIAKGEGDAPVRAYIAAIPGWKQEVGRRLDALIARAVPRVHKAVKWNSPFYGVEGRGWFLSFHCFTKYVKVTFFRGTSLRPVPPGESKHPEVRYLDIREDDRLDEKVVTSWIRQASKLPGWIP